MVFTLNLATTAYCAHVYLVYCNLASLYIPDLEYAYTILISRANIDVNDLAPATKLKWNGSN